MVAQKIEFSGCFRILIFIQKLLLSFFSTQLPEKSKLMQNASRGLPALAELLVG